MTSYQIYRVNGYSRGLVLDAYILILINAMKNVVVSKQITQKMQREKNNFMYIKFRIDPVIIQIS